MTILIVANLNPYTDKSYEARIKSMSFLWKLKDKTQEDIDESLTESLYNLQEFRDQAILLTKLSELEGDSGRVNTDLSMT